MQAADDHPFKLYPVFPDPSALVGITVDSNMYKKMFFISAAYYKQVLMVKNVAATSRRYPGAGTCGVTVPQQYIDSGYDQTLADTIIFIDIVQTDTVSFAAQASLCAIGFWPYYGFIRFNGFYMTTNASQTGKFHQNVYITVSIG